MATGNAWLQQQRKTDLTNIAKTVGLKDYNKFNKNDLETTVENHLRANESSLRRDPLVAPFYQGVDPASPVKHQALVQREEKKPRARRTTMKAKEESEVSDSDPPTTLSSTALSQTRTPASSSRTYAQNPVPASPALIAHQIDAQTSALRSRLVDTYTASPLPTTLAATRTALSSVTAIELLVLAVEAWGLRSRVLPLRYLMTLPAFLPPALTGGIGQGGLPVKIPDLFALVTMAFWGPVGLWVCTSVLLPALAGWFVNLQGRRSQWGRGGGCDPVSFNTVKALVAWVVYVRGAGVGAAQSRLVVLDGVPGGATGLLVGAAVGGLAGLYDAVLRR